MPKPKTKDEILKEIAELMEDIGTGDPQFVFAFEDDSTGNGGLVSHADDQFIGDTISRLQHRLKPEEKLN